MPTTKLSMLRTRWAAIGAAVAVTLGAGGIGLVNADKGSGQRAVTTAITACRLADTRTSTQIGAKAGAFEPGETFTFAARGDQGECTIPDDVIGLDLNVTAVDATQPTYLTVWDTGPLPNASSLNPVPGQPPTPNAVTVDLAGDGTFKVYNLQGNVDVIVDVVAIHQHHHHDDRYFTTTQSDNRYPGKTQTIVIPATAFAQPIVSSGNRFVASDLGAFIIEGGSETMIAPLTLPVGSTITTVRYMYRDNDATKNITFYLSEVIDGFSQHIGEFTSTGSGPELRTGTVALNYVVTAGTSMSVAGWVFSWDSSDAISIESVEIDYELP